MVAQKRILIKYLLKRKKKKRSRKKIAQLVLLVGKGGNYKDSQEKKKKVRESGCLAVNVGCLAWHCALGPAIAENPRHRLWLRNQKVPVTLKIENLLQLKMFVTGKLVTK